MSLSDLTGVFGSIEVTFEQHTEVTVDPPQFSLACRTQGGPATTVVWKRDGTTVADDGNHTTSQIVLDAGSAIYYNVLVVTGREGGEYECTVSHDRISIAESLTVEGTYLYVCTYVSVDVYCKAMISLWRVYTYILVYYCSCKCTHYKLFICYSCEH